MIKKERYSLTVQNRAVLAFGTEIYDFKTMTGTIVDSLQEAKALAVETNMNVVKAQKTILVSYFRKNALKETVLSLTEELLFVRVERAIHRDDLAEMTALVRADGEECWKITVHRVHGGAEYIRRYG